MAPDADADAIDVVVVEDDEDLRDEVLDFLSDRGVRVRGVGSGAMLERALQERPADAVVLDLALPGEDGIVIARRLRARGDGLAIIMMTARTGVEERVLGYETGADVYLVKPVDYPELMAAIRATVRRRRPDRDDTAAPPLAWTLDLGTWHLEAPSGAAVELTRAEMQVLEMLAGELGQPVAREAIARHMGKSPDAGDHRYIDAIISRLRRKIIGTLGWDPPIRTAHTKGYHFAGVIERRGHPKSRERPS